MRAGWALRWREHPPLWQWLGYRMLGLRLSEKYRFWVMDDLLGVLYAVRFMVPAVIAWVGVMLVMTGSLVMTADTLFNVAYIGMLVGFMMTKRRFRARHDWRKFVGPEPPLELQPRRGRRLASGR